MPKESEESGESGLKRRKYVNRFARQNTADRTGTTATPRKSGDLV
jgi:hypothetical protein